MLCSFSTPFLSTYGASIENAERLGLGGNKMMTSEFGDLQLAHFNHDPLVLTLIGSTEGCQVGEMRDFSHHLQPLIQDIAKTVIRE